MALIQCHECNGQVSDQAAACPHCGAPAGKGVQTAQASTVTALPSSAQTKSKGSKWWLWILLVPVIGFVGLMIIGSTVGDTPEAREKDKARAVIKLCWGDQGRKSNTPDVARFIAGTCEKLEDQFRAKFGVNP
jgi:hypothetical protein